MRNHRDAIDELGKAQHFEGMATEASRRRCEALGFARQILLEDALRKEIAWFDYPNGLGEPRIRWKNLKD